MDAFDAFSGYGKAWLALMKDHLDLFLLEIKLAEVSLLPLISCALLGLILFSTLWIGFLVLVGYGIFLLNPNLLLALLSPFLLNALMFFIALRYLKGFYKNLRFEKTREHWKAYQQLKLEFEHENKST